MTSNSRNNSSNNSSNNSPSNKNEVEELSNLNEHPNSFNFINRLSMSPETTRILSLDPFSRNVGNLNNNSQDESELGVYRAQRNNQDNVDSPNFNRVQTNKRDFSNINDRSSRADKISAAKTPPNVKALSTADIKKLIEPGIPDQTEYELFDSEISQLSILKDSQNDDAGPTYQFQLGAKRAKTQSDLGDISLFQIPEFISGKDISINQNISSSEMDITTNAHKVQGHTELSTVKHEESKSYSDNISFSYQANDISKTQDLYQAHDYKGERSTIDNLSMSPGIMELNQNTEQNPSMYNEILNEKNLNTAYENASLDISELQNKAEQYKRENDESNLIENIEILRTKGSPQNESSNSDRDVDSYKNLHQPMDHINSDELDRRESVPMDFTVNSIYLPVANKRASLENRNSIPIENNPFSSFSLHPNNQVYDQSQLNRSYMTASNDENIQGSLDNLNQSENTQQNIESSNFSQSQHFNITIPELSGKDTQDSISNIESHVASSHPMDTGTQGTHFSQSSAQYNDDQENISVAPSLPSHYDSQFPSRMSFGMVSFGINISMADHHSSRGVSRLGFGFGPNTQSTDSQTNEGAQSEQQPESIHTDQELITEINTSNSAILPETAQRFEKESRSPKVESTIDAFQEIIDFGANLNLSSKSIHLSSSRNSTPNSKSLLSTKSTPFKFKNDGIPSLNESPSRLNSLHESASKKSPNPKLYQPEDLSFSTLKSPKSSLYQSDIKERSASKLHSATRSINTPSPKKHGSRLENQLSKRSNPTIESPENLLNQVLSSSRSESAKKYIAASPLKKLGISFEGFSPEKLANSSNSLNYSPSRHGSSNILNSASKSANGSSPKPQTLASENTSSVRLTPSKQNENGSINKTISPQRFASASKSYNFESPSRSTIYNRDSHPNITTPSVSNFIFPGDNAILPNEIILSSKSNDKETSDHKRSENIQISPTKSTPLKPHYENDATNSNLDDDLFPNTSIASVLQYTSHHQLDESQVDNFLTESGDCNSDLATFLNRDHMPRLTLEQFYEAVGLDINKLIALEESNEYENKVDKSNQEESDEENQENTMLAQYVISNLKNQQEQFYETMCQTIKSEIDQASSHCQIFENIVKSAGSLVIENYINMLEKDRPEFEKSIRANFYDIKNTQLEEFLNTMEDGLNQYESKLLNFIPMLDRNIKSLEDYCFIVTQIKEKLETHFQDLTKQLKAEEKENIGVESYKAQIVDAKTTTESIILEDLEISAKNNELSERLDDLKSKLLELEKEERLQSQASRLGPDTHLFSKREYSRLNSKYRELISETSIEPKLISEDGLLFLLDGQVEISLSNPKQGGLDYKSLNLKLIEFYTDEQKEILNSFISRLEVYIKVHKNNLKLKELLKFISKIWHQFHLILEKLSHSKLESIAKLEVYPLGYYSTIPSTPIFFLQVTLTVHNDIGTETRNEIVVTNKFTVNDMLKFPNCLGIAKAEKTSGNVKDYEMVKIKNNLKFYKKYDPISIMYDAQAAVNLIDLPKYKAQVKSSPRRIPFKYSFTNPARSELGETEFDFDKLKNMKPIPNAREKLENLPELGPDEAPTFLHSFKAYLIRKGLFEEFMGYGKI